MIHYNYKERKETLFIYIVATGMTPISFDEAYTKAWRKGMIGTGFHYFIDSSGIVSEDRPIEAVADERYENNDKAIYILVEAESVDTDTFEQEEALTDLISDLTTQYPIEEVIRETGWTADSILKNN